MDIPMAWLVWIAKPTCYDLINMNSSSISPWIYKASSGMKMNFILCLRYVKWKYIYFFICKLNIYIYMYTENIFMFFSLYI